MTWQRMARVPATALTRSAVLLIVCALLLAETAPGQTLPKLPVIGILATGQDRSRPPYPALERALRERGLIDGQTVRIEFRMAQGRHERLPRLATELVRAHADVI